MKSVLGTFSWQIAFKIGWDEFALQSNALEMEKKPKKPRSSDRLESSNRKAEGLTTNSFISVLVTQTRTRAMF